LSDNRDRSASMSNAPTVYGFKPIVFRTKFSVFIFPARVVKIQIYAKKLKLPHIHFQYSV
jgi:hypothetical protein